METVHNLGRLISKGVRTKDGSDLGDILATDETHITIQGIRIYKIPIQFIDFFNGSEVLLNISYDEVTKYKTF